MGVSWMFYGDIVGGSRSGEGTVEGIKTLPLERKFLRFMRYAQHHHGSLDMHTILYSHSSELQP